MVDIRRKHPRVTVLPADLRIVHLRPYTVIEIVDLSRGGLKLEIDGEVPKVGDLLDITMSWPKGDTQINAMVRHVTPKSPGDSGRHFVGVEFDDPELIETLAGEDLWRSLDKDG